MRSPIDEERRDELLVAFQTHYHPGDARSVSATANELEEEATTRTTKRSAERIRLGAARDRRGEKSAASRGEAKSAAFGYANANASARIR